MHPLARCNLPALLLAANLSASAAHFTFPTQTLTVPDGFTVELVAAPPLALRPMMADFDEQGRLYVADSSGSNDPVAQQLEDKPHRIVRLEDTNQDGTFDTSVVFADQLMFPEGVLHFDGAVYTGAPPTIWKLEDTDDDGIADRRTEWHQGQTLTGCANDLHGPYLGPDGWIYWCKGAFAQQTYDRPGYRPINDSAAHIFRALPDHSQLDAVMSGGMDNPVEVAFGPEGEVFFITTFFHHPAAGRRDAIVHAIYGGAYPKPHGVLDNVQQTGELLPPLVELGPAAACALTRYTSDQFGPEYQDNLFSTEFNLRKVMRHVLTPVGSTYTSANEDFLVSDNPDFHPTDVWEDADGSLLVIDTGGWYKICCPTSQLPKPDVLGAIYRIRRTGAHKINDPRGLKLDWQNISPEELVTLLHDSRPFVQDRAIRHLAHLGRKSLSPLARAAADTTLPISARRNAVWALTRIHTPEARATVRSLLTEAYPSLQQTALHSVAMHRDYQALPEVLNLLNSTNPFLQRKAAEALGRIGDPSSIQAIFKALGSFRDSFPENPDAVRIQEHALIFALIEIADTTTTRQGLDSTNPNIRRAALIALDQIDESALQPADVIPLMSASDSTLRQTARWITQHHLDWAPAVASVLQQRLLTDDLATPELEEVQQQLTVFLRHAAVQDMAAKNLIDPATTLPVRRLLLQAMSDAAPSPPPQSWINALVSILKDIWMSAEDKPLDAANEEFLRQAIHAASAWPFPKNESLPLSLSHYLTFISNTRAFPDDLRIQALAAAIGRIPSITPELFDLLLKSLDPQLPASQRAAATRALTRITLTPEQLARLAKALALAGPMELNTLLDAFKDQSDAGLGLQIVASIKSSPALRTIQPTTLKTLLHQFPSEVEQQGLEILRELDADPAEQSAKIEQLISQLRETPGDIRRGQAIFNSEKTACATCHAMGYLGGKVGPDLTRIGQIRTERDLLEALVYPSNSFVRSYEPVVVSTSDGEDYSGILANETASEIQLTLGANSTIRIARSEITEMRPGTLSVMPSGLDTQLTPQELSDLLAFLTNTRWGAR
jgi:putative membrane-bound dehydrogenase-like protein